MTKLTLPLGILFLFLIITSCSSEDNTDSNINSNFKFNPPTWIQGIWFEENSLSGYKFTSDDIISLTLDEDDNIIREDSRKSAFSNFVDVSPSVKESVSETLYSATVTMNGQEYGFYEFNKTSEYSISSGTSLTWIKQ
tara:strand:- start:1781 stop:2194 length:414 start_codon:yes stop_codon:yes gene_type:complete